MKTVTKMNAEIEVPDLRECDKQQLVELLKSLPVERWNEAYARARREGGFMWKPDLSGSDLSVSDLRGSDLRWSDLSGSDLRWSDLRWSNLSGSNLRGSNLRWSNLSGSNLSVSNLSGSNLSGSNLRGSNLNVDDEVVKLDGHYLAVGPVAGYTVQLFGAENDAKHVVTAGCWTVTLGGMIERAEEDNIEGAELDAVKALHTYLTTVVAGWDR